MDKGICYFFGYDVDKKHHAKTIKDYGFDCVMCNADPKFDARNGTFKNQLKQLKAAGLKHSSLHMQYNVENLKHFFVDDKIGQLLEKNLVKDIKTANKYGFKCVVVHMLADKITTVGEERFERILKVAEKHNIPLALENIDDNLAFYYFMDKYIDHKYVMWCYDVGHAHCYTSDQDLTKKYGKKLICLHLHDNDGLDDDHTLNEFGNINWNNIAKQLASVENNFSLDYELLFSKPCSYTKEEVLKIAYMQATDLENLILKYKKKQKTNN